MNKKKKIIGVAAVLAICLAIAIPVGRGKFNFDDNSDNFVPNCTSPLDPTTTFTFERSLATISYVLLVGTVSYAPEKLKFPNFPVSNLTVAVCLPTL